MMIDDRSVQRALQARGYYAGAIDGDIGDKSIAGMRLFTAAAQQGRPTWDLRQLRIATEQKMMADVGIKVTIDGATGPLTQIALEKWQDYITFTRPALPDAALTHQPDTFPRQRDAAAFYGAPGQNLAKITPAYQVFYAGQPIKTITINSRCADSAVAILSDVKARYGEARIKELQLDDFGGCFNNRPMRNGTQLSMHAFACAWDWDADRNPLRATSATAQFARAEYKDWIDIHYAHGWISLGRERNFDWMHFQAARL